MLMPDVGDRRGFLHRLHVLRRANRTVSTTLTTSLIRSSMSEKSSTIRAVLLFRFFCAYREGECPAAGVEVREVIAPVLVDVCSMRLRSIGA
jgi:hypothetical protein